jgi:hypothetical protein
MEILNGDNIGFLPFKGLKKITDLIYYEGPVLSHFIDEFDKIILFYWIDYNSEYNRWLVFQITEEQLYKYLLRGISLLNLFGKPVNDIFYTIEIADTLEYKNVVQIIKGNLPSVYIPESNSYFNFKIPAVYNKVKAYEESAVRELFKSQAVYLKAKPKSTLSHGLVSAVDGGNLLLAFGNSFNALVEVSVKNAFIERKIVSKKRIKNATDIFLKDFQQNIVISEAASFAIAITPNDFVQTKESFLNREWKQSLFEKFKNEVIAIDIKTSSEIDAIINNYSREDGIADIYKPIIELYNNDNISINITDKNFKEQRVLRRIPENVADRLTSSIKILKPQVEHQEFDRFGLIKVDETGKPTRKPPTLFESDISSAWSTNHIILEAKTYKLSKPILSNYRYEKNVHFIENDILNIFASGEDYTETVSDFYRQFDDLYNSYKTITPETTEQVAIKATLDTLVLKEN